MQVRGNAPARHGHNPGDPAGGAADQLPSGGGYQPHRIPHYYLATLKWHRREESLTGISSPSPHAGIAKTPQPDYPKNEVRAGLRQYPGGNGQVKA
jgi:hypothetical protein